MTEQSTAALPELDFENLAERWVETAQKTAGLASSFAQAQSMPEADEGAIEAFQDMAVRLASNPMALAQAQIDLWTGMTEIWTHSAARMAGLDVEPAQVPAKGDRRFKGEAWQEDATFDYIKQTYLLVSDWMQGLSDRAEGMDEQDRRKVQFLSRQFASAISPSNFLMTNPDVIQKTMESGGENLLGGFEHLLADLERGRGKLKISMTDQQAFKVGENVATTPGKVIFRNHLFELIQYSPITEQVHKTPVLFVPPWINKFYVMDLQPENSLIKWVVDQGMTLFVISWVNPGPEEADTAFADYMKDGVLVALDVVQKATREEKVNALGFCIGGILLTTTLAYMAAKGDDRINCATVLATMIDMTDVGEMSVFIDDEQLKSIERKVADRGYLEGQEMADMFNMMRENDLIWSFVVNNYLMGRDPMPFDLLYWNSDSTRLPAKMIVQYLTDFYRDNAFMNPGRLTIDGVAIDVSKIKTPMYMVATKDDHIAPWKSCFCGVTAFSGPTRFVLGASGHIAGIINPPAKNKYCFWTNDAADVPGDPDEWFASAAVHEGSWWGDWTGWLKERGGQMTAARMPEDSGFELLADAPGDYVRVRSD